MLTSLGRDVIHLWGEMYYICGERCNTSWGVYYISGERCITSVGRDVIHLWGEMYLQDRGEMHSQVVTHPNM